MLAMYFYGNQGENSELVCGLVQPIQKVAEKRMNALVPSNLQVKAKYVTLTDVKMLYRLVFYWH